MFCSLRVREILQTLKCFISGFWIVEVFCCWYQDTSIKQATNIIKILFKKKLKNADKTQASSKNTKNKKSDGEKNMCIWLQIIRKKIRTNDRKNKTDDTEWLFY